MPKKFLMIALFVLMALSFRVASAAEEGKVEYDGKVIVDSDLDGLTDQGEIQLYKTDFQKFDTDGDNFSDGVEILSETDPLDVSLYPGSPPPIIQQEAAAVETPWAWYFSRVSGLVAFALLYVSIFLGLTLRIPFLRKIFSPVYSLNVHCWISLQATLIAFLHGAVLMGDKYLNLSLGDLFVPFVSPFQTNLIALGIFGFYLMILLVVTSYGKKYISHKLWRAVHFANIVLYVIVLIHAFKLGTDLKNPVAFNVFLWMNAFLVFLMLANMQLRISDSIRIRRARASQQEFQENSDDQVK